MNFITTGFHNVKLSYRLMLYCIVAWANLMTSCTKPEREEFTDVYYIRNDLDKSISLTFNYAVFWDTCTSRVACTETPVRVWLGNNDLDISAQSTIRLHPISRAFIPTTSHHSDPVPVIGSVTKLIVTTDTIVWKAAKSENMHGVTPCMFTNDFIWSIYNTKSWETEQSLILPNTFYHTFSVTKEDLERSTQL